MTKKALVLRDFRDAGTDESFAAGELLELDDGRFENFRIAELVRLAPRKTNRRGRTPAA